jgi:hypothetical protein
MRNRVEDTREGWRWWTGTSSGLAIFLGLREPVDSEITFLRNIGNYLPVDTVEYTTRFEPSATPLSESQVPQVTFVEAVQFK